MSDDTNKADEITANLVKYNVLLRGYVYAVLRDRNQVDDVMQEIAVAVWQMRDRFELGTNFVAWVKAIAFYRIREFLRKHNRPDCVPLDDWQLETLTDESFEERVSDLMIRREEALLRCLDQIPERSRQALLSYYSKGNDYASVARLLDQSVATAQVIFHRLREKLRVCVEKRLAGSQGAPHR